MLGGQSAGSDYVGILNFVTNYDKHVFTAEDVGTHTVQVMFGGAVYEYTITVTE
jgi:hypothetical protein